MGQFSVEKPVLPGSVLSGNQHPTSWIVSCAFSFPRCSPGTPSLKATAGLLMMHPRTLNWTLEKRGFSFRDAVNEARFEIASQLLRDTRVRIGSLAQVLGYSEASAFTRFFTSMAGQPPSEWKEKELAGFPG